MRVKRALLSITSALACLPLSSAVFGQRISGANLGLMRVALESASAANKPACFVDSGFSPEGSAEQWVYYAIDSAQSSIRLGAYSFTSREVVRRLIDAKDRGVDVAVVVDERSNVDEDRSGRSRAALNSLVKAGIPTRTLAVYQAAHDKDFVVDGRTVETGSYNFSDSAARRNSENAVVIWNCPVTAKLFLDHWQSRWNQAVAYRASSPLNISGRHSIF